jgi:hypothetical protein
MLPLISIFEIVIKTTFFKFESLKTMTNVDLILLKLLL